MLDNKLSSILSNGSLLAICNSNGVLKLWNTSSNILEHEFHPGKYLSSSVTCLQFSPKNRKKNFKNKKKRSSVSEDAPSDILVALGTLDGSVLVYSPDKQKVTSTLVHSPTLPVIDISWQSPNKLVSVGEDKKLILWNISSTKLCVLDIIESKSICALGENHFVTGNTSLQFLKYDEETTEVEQYVVPGHKSSITQLVPVFLNQDSCAKYVLSSAENDRFVYAWSCTSNAREPIGSFMVKDIVQSVCCLDLGESSIGIAVTTKKGVLRFFRHHFNGSKNLKPVNFEGSLVIKSSSKKTPFLTILNASFLSPFELLISYGTELFPHCEKVSIDSLKDQVSWTRKDPSVFTKTKKSSLVKTLTPHVSSAAVHLTPAQMNPRQMKEVSAKRKKGGGESNLPMEERLDALSLTQTLPGAPDGRPLDNYVHLLIQALHSKDSSLMNSILAKGEDEEMISSTVRRLPVSQVVPFLQYLQGAITSKGLKNLACINWIKSVLYHHMSLLSTVPDKETLLQPFYNIFAARTSSLLAVSKLHSRLSLLLEHVKNRQENATRSLVDTHSEALLKYKEDSSDDELDMRVEMEGGPSESEDIWDDWTEDESEDHKEEEEGGGGEEGDRRAPKRKLPHEDDLISLGDSTDGEEEEEEEGEGEEEVQSVTDSE